MQLMRYYDGGTVDLKGSYIGYVLVGTSASNRINENSEALYDPYINGSGNLKPSHATDKQYLVFQCWAPGITFNNFKFKIGIYEGLQLRPFILPSGETAKSNVIVYNRTANKLNMPTALNIEDSGITITYDPVVQEFLLSGTATATKDISLNATFNALSGDRLSIKRLYQSGDVTAAGGTLPRLKLVNSANTTIVYNDIYKMTAPEGQTPTPDVNFNTGTAPADATLTLKLGITNGQVFDNYRFRLMIHDKSTDIGYVAYRRESLGNMSVGANERAVLEFKAIPYGILEFVAAADSLNLLFGDSITDLTKTYLEYNTGIISPIRKISELTDRAELIDNPFRNKVIAVWGDSRESNNPTSDPSGVGDQKDTSWPALLAKKLNATVLNYGLSGSAWAENTVQQDAASAIVNRVQTEDVSASADVIIISSMNDFKLASPLGSPLPTNKDKTTFYGAMRLTYERLATKYPGKKIVLVLPQKRYDETVNYGGGSYYHYLKAQVEVANEYGIPVVDLYNNMPGVKGTAFYNTYMLNDTHWSAVGNDRVAELVARELIGNGNKGNMDRIPPIPTTDGTYTLKVTITGGIPVFSWVAN
jgi:lysophospholipase L1-like esterase